MSWLRSLDEKDQIIFVCRRLYEKGLVAGADGNISMMLSGGNSVLITSSGTHKGLLTRDDLLTVGMDGKVVKGHGHPSSELAMHLAIYAAEERTKAIIHVHPPWTLAVTLSRGIFPVDYLVESRMLLKDVPVVPFRRPGGEGLAREVVNLLGEGPAIVLANHGAVTRGKTIQEAFCAAECLENTAKIFALGSMLGTPRPIPNWKG